VAVKLRLLCEGGRDAQFLNWLVKDGRSALPVRPIGGRDAVRQTVLQSRLDGNADVYGIVDRDFSDLVRLPDASVARSLDKRA